MVIVFPRRKAWQYLVQDKGCRITEQSKPARKMKRFGRLKKKDDKNNGLVDRRIFTRLSVKLPLRFLEPGDKREHHAQVINISANGIGFINKKRLAPNTYLQMWLNMPDHCKPLYIIGKVIWSKSLEIIPSRWRVGAEVKKVNLVGLGRICLQPE
jgi:hypothetical protein